MRANVYKGSGKKRRMVKDGVTIRDDSVAKELPDQFSG